MKEKILPAALASLLLTFSLSGCSFLARHAADAALKSAASKAGVSYDSKNGGVTVSTSSGTAQVGGAVSWPKTWPAELPKLEGTVAAVTDTDLTKQGGILVMVKVSGADAVRGYAKRIEQLGYQKVMESSDSGGYAATFVGAKYTVGVMTTGEDEATVTVGQGSGSSSKSGSSSGS